MTFTIPISMCYSLLAIEAILILSLFSLKRRARRLTIQRNALLQEKDVVFNFVHDVGDVFAGTQSVDLNALLTRVLFYALRTTKAGAGALYLVDPDGETLRAQAISGVFPPLAGAVEDEMARAFSKIRYAEQAVRTQTIPIGSGLVGEVAAEGTTALIQDAERDPRVPRFSVDFFEIHSILLVPMRFHNEVLGVLVVVNRVDGLPFIESDQNMLEALADQASVSIHYAKFSAALDEKRRLDYDLSIARHIQTALLPKTLPQIAGVEVAAFSEPAQQIGGDYYDFVPVDDDHLGIAIADVSGKGVSAAIVMSICRSLLRIVAPGCLSPAAVLRKMNAILARDLSEDMFVSMLYLVLNTKTRELYVARAGHTSPIINPGDGGQPITIESPGMAVGMADPETFDAVLDERKTLLRPGDIVLTYTDGVTEAMDPGENEWGVLNLVKTMQITALDGGGAAKVAENVQQRLMQFVGDTPQYDDMTLVVLKVV